MKIRNSAGVIPLFKNTKTGQWCVVLVTSSDGSRWVFPKGGIEIGQTPRLAAYTEAYEEAGVITEVGRSVGTYRYVKKNGVVSDVEMFVGSVTKTLTTKEWGESHKRRRSPFPIKEALTLVDSYLKVFILEAMDILEANGEEL